MARRTHPHRWPAALATAMALSLAGCGERTGRDIPASGAGATWRWRAVNMEVSALSTPIDADPSRGPAIDVRIEFFDSERDETKALGSLSVRAVFDSNEVGRTALDLGSQPVHGQSWDSVTETYSARVPLAIAPPPGRIVVIQATFEGVDGARMTASREIRWPERGK